jgi:hypothetical protein
MCVRVMHCVQRITFSTRQRMKLISHINNSVPASVTINSFSITQANILMLFREIFDVDWENHMKHINTVRSACRFFRRYMWTSHGYINTDMKTEHNIIKNKLMTALNMRNQEAIRGRTYPLLRPVYRN